MLDNNPRAKPIPPTPDWNQIAAIVTQNSFLHYETKQSGRLPVLAIQHPDPAVIQYLYRTLHIGQQPREVNWYKKENGQHKRIWCWKITAQLEVYWFLSNLQRFTRGPLRVRIETALQQLEDHLQTANRLRRYALGVSLKQEEELRLTSHMQSSGFLERTEL